MKVLRKRPDDNDSYAKHLPKKYRGGKIVMCGKERERRVIFEC